MVALEQSLFLVNTRSGGGSGVRVYRELAQLLPQATVADLITSDILGLITAASTAQQPVIVCGGDGSIASVLDLVYEHSIECVIGLIPLGTGNDLARHLGCRGPADAPLSVILEGLRQSSRCPIDRMVVTGPQVQRSWYNYCSWGLDAEIALYFDGLRAHNRALCRSARINKALYAILGVRMLGVSVVPMLVDGSGLPASTRSVLCANINSYAGGMPLGSQVSSSDGCCDVFALPTALGLLPALMGRRRLRPLQQATHFEIEFTQRVCMQCDGEAFYGAAGLYRVDCVGQLAVLGHV